MKSVAIMALEKGRVGYQEQEVSDPGAKEIQVRACASVISPGTERAFILNLENTDSHYPQHLGYSCAGVVEKVGAEVTDFAVGDRVACIMFHKSIANVNAVRAVHIPDGVSFEDAAFIRLGVIAMQAVRKANIELGETAMVLGLGLIGQIAMQLVRNSGAIQAFGVDRVESKLQMASRLNNEPVINSAEENWIEQLKEQTGGAGPHVVIESTGFPEPISLALQCVRRYGRVVLLGSTRGDSSINFYRDVHKKGVHIIGAHISTNPEFESHPGYWTFRDNGNCFLQLLKLGKVDMQSLVTNQVKWDQAVPAYDKVLSWDSGVLANLIIWE
ncbi:zinc-dependent alcohol dehydrogenase [Paenibacillus cremeus]|uniref:Zinc-binding alcohol dehydrogenase n=1 Tax=Paenibacillus cremeus TaxID=2163881 RepID=A0A559K778_9BACL|nr:zinc-binding alcohol dehydrogenase [Paenibacillus cremeus]TVY07995.1 zinc-binding alcohol dehydrogenase [Paenibacillus cremeus]